MSQLTERPFLDPPARIHGDVSASTAASSSYDFAVMSGVLHHLPTADTRIGSLREAHRLLKPGGRFFSYDPNGLSPSMFLYRDPRSPLYSPAGKTENEILLTRGQLVRELWRGGRGSDKGSSVHFGRR